MNAEKTTNPNTTFNFSSYLFKIDIDKKCVAIYKNDTEYLLVVEAAQGDSLTGYDRLTVSFDTCADGIVYYVVGLFCDDQNDMHYNTARALRSVIDGLKK